MSFRTKRVLVITQFYMLFEFFLLKYVFLLIGGLNDIYSLAMTILIGLNHFMPMLFETRKSRKITRFLTTLDGIWMWVSLMFFMDILIIYFIGSFITLSVSLIISLLSIVPILGVYTYWKAHNLVIHEKTIKLDNLKRDIDIVHLSDVVSLINPFQKWINHGLIPIR